MAFKTTLAHMLVLNYPLPPAQVASMIPPPLELDIHDGAAWLSLLAFEQQQFAPLGRLGPKFSFHQINYRTYVKCQGQRGVYFFRMDLDSGWLARMFRVLFGMPAQKQRIKLHTATTGDDRYHLWELRSPELEISAHNTDKLAADCTWFLAPTKGFFAHRNGTVRHFEVARSPMVPHAAAVKVRRSDFLRQMGISEATTPFSACLIERSAFAIEDFPPTIALCRQWMSLTPT